MHETSLPELIFFFSMLLRFSRNFHRNMSGLTPRTPLNPREYAFIIPGITPRTLDLSKHLLEKNHTEHHIFFNEDGFHKLVYSNFLMLSRHS